METKTTITQEQIDQILELKRLGLRNKEISQETGISEKNVSRVCLANGFRTKSPYIRRANKPTDTLTCPKCKRGGFPKDYLFCPYCTADIRSERDKLLDLLKRTQELFTHPHATEKDSKASYALARTIDYLEAHGDA